MVPGQERDPELSRDTLMKAAEELFLKKGFGKTSLSEIADRAGMTKSLIHHYFGSKKNLWQEVKMKRFDEFAEKQMELFSEYEPMEDLLVGSIKLYFRFLKQNPEILKFLAWMFVEGDDEFCGKKDKAVMDMGLERIKAAQKEGLLRSDIDPRFLVFTFIGLCQHWFEHKMFFIRDFGMENLPKELDEAYLEDMIKIFMEGVVKTGS